jgi:hypothetical protein
VAWTLPWQQTAGGSWDRAAFATRRSGHTGVSGSRRDKPSRTLAPVELPPPGFLQSQAAFWQPAVAGHALVAACSTWSAVVVELAAWPTRSAVAAEQAASPAFWQPAAVALALVACPTQSAVAAEQAAAAATAAADAASLDGERWAHELRRRQRLWRLQLR